MGAKYVLTAVEKAVEVGVEEEEEEEALALRVVEELLLPPFPPPPPLTPLEDAGKKAAMPSKPGLGGACKMALDATMAV